MSAGRLLIWALNNRNIAVFNKLRKFHRIESYPSREYFDMVAIQFDGTHLCIADSTVYFNLLENKI